MSHSDFDWQIGDQGWDTISLDDAPPSDGARPFERIAEISSLTVEHARKRRWVPGRVLIAALTAAILTIAIVSSAILQRVDEASLSAETAVLDNHALVQYAVTQSDRALFATLLSSDSGWRAIAIRLFDRGIFANRGMSGFQPNDAEPIVIDVSLSPDFTEAEVVTEQRYTVVAEGGSMASIRMRHTTHYRLEGRRWLLAPPDSDFWGDSITRDGEYLRLTYPERDDPIARRLADDLNGMLHTLCDEVAESNCRTDLRVHVTLATDPRGLIGLSTAGRLWTGNESIYQDGQRFAHLSLPTITWVGVPLDETSYQALFRAYAVRTLRAAIADLAARNGYLMPNSLQARQAVLDRYLIDLDLRPWPTVPVDRVREPPIPLPNQDIALACAEGLQSDGSLILYDPAAHTWSDELAGRQIDGVTPLPELGGPLAEGALPATPLRLALWRGTDVRSLRGFPAWSPDGTSYLIAWDTAFGALVRGEAQRQALRQIPTDGSHPFWLDGQTYGYVRSAPQSALETPVMQILTARIPYNIPRVVLEAEDLLAALPANARQGRSVSDIGPILSNPGNPDRWLILAETSSGRQGLSSQTDVFLYHRRSGALSFLKRFERDEVPSSLDLTSDGRWLLTSVFDAARAMWSLRFHAIEGKEITDVPLPAYGGYPDVLPAYDWSADGKWVLVMHDGVLYLIAPEHAYSQAIAPPSPGCALATWVDR